MEAHRAMLDQPARFGNTLRLREEAQDVWGWGWLDDVGRDLRFAARTLRRSPGLRVHRRRIARARDRRDDGHLQHRQRRVAAAAAVCRPDRLVQVAEIHQTGGAGWVAFGDLQAFRAESVSFERFSGYELTTRLLETTDGSERVTAVISDREFFPLLGVGPLIGRTFATADPSSVVVLSAALWERQFAPRSFRDWPHGRLERE